MIATKVHSRRLQRVRDVPVAGAVEVVWAKRRWFCSEPRCGRGTFAEATGQVPRFARSTGAVEGPESWPRSSSPVALPRRSPAPTRSRGGWSRAR
ncbi:transposase family protein [Janibacter limosus]|uniref:transposase family protein n=1 Tax=Janibacter limosus TaxID=53458 RepID=UPI0035E35B4D|nr:transposase family protein [Janibacter limosus]